MAIGLAAFAATCVVIAAIRGLGGVPGTLGTFAQGVGGSATSLGNTVEFLTPILLVASGALLAFRSGLADIGQVGQFLFGGLTAGALAPVLPGPGWLLIAELVLLGAAAGALWALLVNVFARQLGIQLIVVSLIANYLAQGLATFLNRTLAEYPNLDNVIETRAVPTRAWLPILLPRTTLHAGIVLAVLITLGVVITLRRTAIGHRITMLGKGPEACALWGTPRAMVWLRVNTVSGAICGLAGADEVLGVYHRYIDGTLGGPGSIAWTGLTVALLVPAGVAAIIPVSFAMAALTSGFIEVQIELGLSTGLGTALQGALVVAAAVGIRSAGQARASEASK